MEETGIDSIVWKLIRHLELISDRIENLENEVKLNYLHQEELLKRIGNYEKEGNNT